MSEQLTCVGIRVRRSHVQFILDQASTIEKLFGVRVFQPVGNPNDGRLAINVETVAPELLAAVTADVQNYVDSVVTSTPDPDQTLTGEDSSYDSDFEGEERPHQDVSRTTSDTLAAEFAEYVSSSAQYAAKLEFALKLGYTEKQVQASLTKLGPNPGQNELLEELIKLGAQCVPLTRTQDSPLGLGLCEKSRDSWTSGSLRPIVIDGSNVAMSHGNKAIFSCKGIEIAVDWFRARGHTNITVFVPKWRKEAPRPDNTITDQEILSDLERERILVFTPSRLIGGKRTICYDDRYVLRLAVEIDGIVVSNDNYRDLAAENADFKRVVEERTLMYSFVNDRFMPPDDPLGRSGPTLDNFLRMPKAKVDPPPPCPYGKKCTYGNKCKYYHPERGPLHKSVTERLAENVRRHGSGGNVVRGKSLSVPLAAESGSSGCSPVGRKMPLARSRSGVASVPSHNLTHSDEKIGKSPSVENVRSVYHQPLSSSPPPPPQQQQQQQHHVDSSTTNLHKKLQRQLTLNPCYDPRLWEMQAYVHLWGDPMAHTSVTRIASAPAPFCSSASSSTTLRMASDPTLYRPPTTEETRRKLHYHLASIFPEEHVIAAMRSLPDETRPQEICAAILAMFPSP